MSGEIRVTYFDTAMVMIEVGGARLLTDPVLDPAGSAFDYGLYRLEKTSPVSVTPEQLGRIDAVLLSHEQHGDNLDRAGELLRGVPRVLTTPAGASVLGGVAEGLSDWESVTVEGAEGGAVTVTGVPAQHGPDGSSGGETTLVEAGLRRIAPAAFRYSKKEQTTESLKATVAALFFCARSLSLQSTTSCGITSSGCFIPVNWKNSMTARR
jgi:L-ascorbate metabolism protein UlaG (beta-lactamase superfamily)